MSSPSHAPRPPASPSAEGSSGGVQSVDNAGVVLFAPFLPHLFERCGLLEGGTFRNEAGAWHAAHLIQHCTDPADLGDRPTSLLSRWLAGVGAAPERSVVLSEEQRTLCAEVLHAVIRNWTDVGQISVTALRETFLRRPGRLERREVALHLTVHRQTVDVLVDRVPWAFSVIRHPWMPQPLSVTW